jgi:hypothetical protein
MEPAMKNRFNSAFSMMFMAIFLAMIAMFLPVYVESSRLLRLLFHLRATSDLQGSINTDRDCERSLYDK